jgi:hypothetical protein
MSPMTVIYIMFLGSFYISFSHFEDQLQGKNLKKWSYLFKMSRIEENAKEKLKWRKYADLSAQTITGATSIGMRSVHRSQCTDLSAQTSTKIS